MQKRTVLDQIEIARDGTINLRIAKEILDDDGTVLQSGWHRTLLPPGIDIDIQMDLVNQNLVRDLKCLPVPDADIARVKAIAKVAWK